MLKRAGDALEWRARFLFGDNPFAMRERMRFVMHRGASRPGPQELLEQAHRAPPGQEPYFALGPGRLYFRPNDGKPRDEQKLLWATRVILHEAFFEQDHEYGPVCVNRGDVVIDLGGNIGTSALAFARRVGRTGRVYSFEPVTPELIEKNARANGQGEVVEPVGVAAGDRCGQIELAVGDYLIDSSFARDPNTPTHTIHVPVTTLDEFVSERGLERLDFIKIDIEGAEELALEGARETLRRFRPKLTIASYHTDHRGQPQHDTLVRWLKDAGYQIHEVAKKRIYAWCYTVAALLQAPVPI